MANDLDNKITGAQILNAYVPDHSTEVRAASILLGLVGIVLGTHGIESNNAAEAVVGVGLDAGVGAKFAFDYVRAYFEAKLDYLQNGRFTKLDEDKK